MAVHLAKHAAASVFVDHPEPAFALHQALQRLGLCLRPRGYLQHLFATPPAAPYHGELWVGTSSRAMPAAALCVDSGIGLWAPTSPAIPRLRLHYFARPPQLLAALAASHAQVLTVGEADAATRAAVTACVASSKLSTRVRVNFLHPAEQLLLGA
ncbi:MAG: hypothetical protein EOO40_08635 [Deltaproteobacteria bacterium]|nr:MAG: hypothetical protein EOO40_08635 [Deltaproteobacteria bacterium]